MICAICSRAELLEDDDVVDAVQKLGLEMIAQHLQHVSRYRVGS